ncbi:LysR substrate-binding domain-containing protein [Shimia biformata]|uniref:LysR substrate-binding domain-containing protein n=1 Tax=Shimia biformata TaxID=1294299 RepID=UPI001951C7C9|nr:LysR substrate-binding domain-containing protein [Shimia biformata]
MRHSQLKAFHNVATLGGFSRAAEAMGLTQPAISEQVKTLETENDVLLFARKGRQIALTAAGEDLFLLTKRYFETEAQIAEYLSAWGHAVSGELRIVADSAQHVTDLLAAFRARHPEVRITLRAGNTEDVLEELRNYNAEIGVVGSLPQARDLTAMAIGSSPITGFARRGLVAGGAAGMTLAEFAQYPLIFREEKSRTRQQVADAAQDLGVTLAPSIVAEGREAVRAIVLAGSGIGFVSEAEFSADDRLEKIPILDLDMQMPESIVHLTQRRGVRVVRAFMELAARQARALAAMKP